MKALITGITGQDGSYLAEHLLDKGYEVCGLYRRSSVETFERINHLKGSMKLVCADLTDYSSLPGAVTDFKPDELYNLAAQSFVPASWTQPIATTHMNCIGTLALLDIIRKVNPEIRFYQASSSEMFGKVRESPQTENTQFYPRSPYAVTKVYSYWITRNYRESYGLFASNGILFNHESPRRGKQFVTRKISHSVAKIKKGLQDCFELGNMDANRDWGYADDYVRAMRLMLNHDSADDFVVATGETHSVREFVTLAFKAVDMDIDWQGEGLKEEGIVGKKTVVRVAKEFFRPAEVDLLMGDSTKARKVLGWEPKVTFKELVKIMVQSDLDSL